MAYDYKARKIVAVLSAELETGIALNVIGHLAISIGAYGKDLMGRAQIKDASGLFHKGLSKYPFIITKLKSNKLKALVEEVRKYENIMMADYPEQVLTTAHDDDLAAAVESTKHDDMKYLGAILYGEAELLTKLTGRFSLWR